MDYPVDPVTGRNFDGRYDERHDCGCVDFYKGGLVACRAHSCPECGRHFAECKVRQCYHGGAKAARDHRTDAERQADGGW